MPWFESARSGACGWRRKHAFELQTVSIDEEYCIVAAAFIVLRILGGGIQDRRTGLNQKVVHSVDRFAAFDRPSEVVKPGRITVMKPLGAFGARFNDVDRMRSGRRLQLPAKASLIFPSKVITQAC